MHSIPGRRVAYIDPGVVHKLANGHPLSRVSLQQLVNQLFGYRQQNNIKQTKLQGVCTF